MDNWTTYKEERYQNPRRSIWGRIGTLQHICSCKLCLGDMLAGHLQNVTKERPGHFHLLASFPPKTAKNLLVQPIGIHLFESTNQVPAPFKDAYVQTNETGETKKHEVSWELGLNPWLEWLLGWCVMDYFGRICLWNLSNKSWGQLQMFQLFKGGCWVNTLNKVIESEKFSVWEHSCSWKCPQTDHWLTK